MFSSLKLLWALTEFGSSLLADSTNQWTQPTELLFSPLVAQKVAATSNDFSGTFPQYTTRDTGKWLWFTPNTWTSGFFPATLYAMNTRKQLCPHTIPGNYDWLTKGRDWSLPLVSIETHNTVQHDVGFISYPFQEELLV
jgi:hypothetical protein